MLAPHLTLPLLAEAIFSPLTILILCTIAAVGTILLLPGRRESTIRFIGGAILLASLLIFIALIVRQGAAHAGSDVYFWLFSAIAIISAIRVISHPKPVYS